MNRARSAEPQDFPLVAELAPAPDFWATVRRLAHLPHLLVLHSSEFNADRGRYSFVSAGPKAWRQCYHEEAQQYVAEMTTELATHRLASVTGLPPFQGGAAGVFGYGLQHLIERIPQPRHDEFRVPDLSIGIYDWVIAFDHELQRAWAISTGYPDLGPKRLETAAKQLDRLRGLLAEHPGRKLDHSRFCKDTIHAADLYGQHPLPGHADVCTAIDQATYLRLVDRAIDYVNAGDCFQVNLSQRLVTPLVCHPLELYERQSLTNPAPYSAYFDMGDFAIVSASPERFLCLRDGNVSTRPIKGTRPRGDTSDEDQKRVAELAASPKDRAENVMIVDLLRNDLGRVCEYGSVLVTKVCEVESFRYVHHLVSEVCGRLAPGKSAMDLLKACFPGGSVTGAPKVRAMEIIAELEPTARGPYCGSLGYFGFDGSVDTNILIRTFTAGRGWLQFPVGGGIVADSDPRREYEETMHKAEGLLRSLQQ